MNLFMNMESEMGKDWQDGLTALKELCEMPEEVQELEDNK